MYLFFDTETTGLPLNWKAPVTDTVNWPRMVQIGWVLFDKKGNELENLSYLIKPKGYTIPKQASDIHRITTEKALSEGKELEAVLELFAEKVKDSSVLVAHNMNFDENIIGCEYVRTGIENPIPTIKKICTMQESIQYCKLPGKFGFKFPRLSELHTKLFGKPFEEAHDALVDVNATARCFWKMVEQKIIKL